MKQVMLAEVVINSSPGSNSGRSHSLYLHSEAYHPSYNSSALLFGAVASSGIYSALGEAAIAEITGSKLGMAGLIMGSIAAVAILHKAMCPEYYGHEIHYPTLVTTLYPRPPSNGALFKQFKIPKGVPIAPGLPLAAVFTGHANCRLNFNPHMVYRIHYLPPADESPTLKYGITDIIRYGNQRPEYQVPKLKLAFGPSVDWHPYLYVQNRETALAVEWLLVAVHVTQWGYRPVAQKRP